LRVVLTRGDDAISPTAHYTAAVWAGNGLSHPALATTEGRVLRAALWPALTASRLAGGPSLDAMLLARHRLIDRLLEAAVADGRVAQVIEVAAGLSPRGWRFSRDHPDLTYVEADLPGMAARKRRALERAGARHRVADLDAFAADGPDSLAALAETLDHDRGLAIVTEGLLNYFDRDAVLDLWGRIAATLREFPDGLYLSDIVLRDSAGDPVAWLASGALSVFVRGRVHVHYAGRDAAAAALRQSGFSRAAIHDPTELGETARGADRVRVIEAATNVS
jgi:O-methyltransferase involved in polyketide biosynthesis